MAVVSLDACREGLANLIGNLPIVRVTSFVPGLVNVPAAIVAPAPGQFITYNETMDGCSTFLLRVTLLTSVADMEQAQDSMDPYLDNGTAASVYAAIAADPTLGGVADDALAMTASNYGVIEWNGVQYLGCHILVSVFV